MTTEQELELGRIHHDGISDFGRLKEFVEDIEKQAAIDALAKAERMKGISDELNLPHNDITRILDMQKYEAILRRLGALESYITCLIGDITPDDRELIAIQFDTHIFQGDEAMAKRFRDFNNTSHENN